MTNKRIELAGSFPGRTAVWYENLVTGDVITYAPDIELIAASVIKLWIMGEAFRRFENCELKKTEEYFIDADMKMPSCGALAYMHDGLRVTALDLVTLMIILSDNTATNILIDRLGIAKINEFIQSAGGGAKLERRLFDSKAARIGLKNVVTARGVAAFFRKLYRGELVSPDADAEMLGILKNQRLNGKIPFFLSCEVAHKTGEDDGVTHDAGIVFGREPCILAALSNETDVPAFERYMQELARDLC